MCLLCFYWLDDLLLLLISELLDNRNMIATVHPVLFFLSSPWFPFCLVSLDVLTLWGSSTCCGDAVSVGKRSWLTRCFPRRGAALMRLRKPVSGSGWWALFWAWKFLKKWLLLCRICSVLLIIMLKKQIGANNFFPGRRDHNNLEILMGF